MGKRLQGRRFRVVFCISFVFLSLIRFRHLFLVLNERLRELIPAGRILTAAYAGERLDDVVDVLSVHQAGDGL